MTPNISELVERLEGAEAGSRELDCAIAVLLDGFFVLPPMWEGGPVGYGYIDKDGSRVSPGHGGDQLVLKYTTSLDAALALAERVMGDGWLWTSGAVIGGSKAFGVLTRLGEPSSIKGNGSTPALALCIATLKALAAMDGSRDE